MSNYLGMSGFQSSKYSSRYG